MSAVAYVTNEASSETILLPTFQPTNSPVSLLALAVRTTLSPTASLALAPFVASASLRVVVPSFVEATVTTTPASSLATASLSAAVAASTSSCDV